MATRLKENVEDAEKGTMKMLLFRMAEEPKTPKLILAVMSRNRDKYLRMLVAENSHTSEPTLGKLGRDGDYDVKTRVLENPNTPDSTVVSMVNDADQRVSREAETVLGWRIMRDMLRA